MNYGIDMVRTGANIRKVLKDHGIAVADMADMLGVTASNAYKWLRGDVMPSLDNLYALSLILGVSMNDLIVAI